VCAPPPYPLCSAGALSAPREHEDERSLAGARGQVATVFEPELAGRALAERLFNEPPAITHPLHHNYGDLNSINGQAILSYHWWH
jgi:hypothetical protein